MSRFEGKTALITGGAQGIGAAIARAFAFAGASVVIGDISDEAGRALKAEIAAAGGESLFVHLDVTSEPDWQGAIECALQRYGRLDVLVNNAGVGPAPAPIEQCTVQEWDRIMAVNARGVFLGTRHAIAPMRAGGGGSIVNVSSLAALGQGTLMEAAYAASKGAVRTFTKVIAAQYAHEGIRCNSVHPGPIDGGMLHGVLSDPTKLERRLSRIPMGRLGRVDEVVAGVMFLASDESSYTTGTELTIDGGALVQ
ncbi:SDR family NAD(P)-dependent oxidoreductase [Piscinibacter sp.]|jgi:NAD(P)-dependent dehydrogenase (short-subunit alcohol dehydrogenase family)|uniref:SDR family NAD(P)-dependent oxidoreductase n=1 Tax=Piscinibacter sp. TaxID=1903157 RepID=UPI00355A3E08